MKVYFTTVYPPDPPKDFNDWLIYIRKLLNSIK